MRNEQCNPVEDKFSIKWLIQWVEQVYSELLKLTVDNASWICMRTDEATTVSMGLAF